MTAPSCKDCAYVRVAKTRKDVGLASVWTVLLTCGVPPKHRPLCTDQRAEDGPCGPDGKLFAERAVA